jgi:ribosomal protein L40E
MDDSIEMKGPVRAVPKEISRNAAKSVSENVSRDVEIENLRSKIQFLNSEIVESKGKIGEYYWRLFLAGGPHEPVLQEIFDVIQTRVDEITALEQDIQMAEDGFDQPIQPPVQIQMDQVICQSCGTTNDTTVKHCSSCGMILKEEESEPAYDNNAEDYGTCPLCGADLPEDAIFCYTCGARIRI